MNRCLLRMILLCVLPMILVGCGSGRKSVRSGGAGRITATAPAGALTGGTGGSSAQSDGGSAYLAEVLKNISDPMARDLLTEAGGWIGTQYVWGGSSRAGTDCSGLVMSVYRNVCGVKIPRTTREQVRYCTQISRNKLQPGDLIFFGKGESVDSVSHVGMYVGDGRMIHASSSRGVIVSLFDTGYWADRYCTGARVEAAPKAYAALGKAELPVVAPVEVSRPISEAPVSRPISDAPVSRPISETPVSRPISETPTITIDLLDQIITAKIDSITSM